MEDTGLEEPNKEEKKNRNSANSCYGPKDIASIEIHDNSGTYKVWEAGNGVHNLPRDLSSLASAGPGQWAKVNLKNGRAIQAKKFAGILAHGKGRLHLAPGSDRTLIRTNTTSLYLEGNFFQGCLDGVVVGYASWLDLPLVEETDLISLDMNGKEVVDDEDDLYGIWNFLGTFKSGKPFGPIWKPVYSNEGMLMGYFYSDLKGPTRLANEVNFMPDLGFVLYACLQRG